MTTQTNIYTYEVDEKSFTSDNARISVATVMEKAGIDNSQGLIQILTDGQQIQLDLAAKNGMNRIIGFLYQLTIGTEADIAARTRIARSM